MGVAVIKVCFIYYSTRCWSQCNLNNLNRTALIPRRIRVEYFVYV